MNHDKPNHQDLQQRLVDQNKRLQDAMDRLAGSRIGFAARAGPSLVRKIAAMIWWSEAVFRRSQRGDLTPEEWARYRLAGARLFEVFYKLQKELQDVGALSATGAEPIIDWPDIVRIQDPVGTGLVRLTNSRDGKMGSELRVLWELAKPSGKEITEARRSGASESDFLEATLAGCAELSKATPAAPGQSLVNGKQTSNRRILSTTVKREVRGLGTEARLWPPRAELDEGVLKVLDGDPALLEARELLESLSRQSDDPAMRAAAETFRQGWTQQEAAEAFGLTRRQVQYATARLLELAQRRLSG